MPSSRAPSLGDDDLQFISMQTAKMSAGTGHDNEDYHALPSLGSDPLSRTSKAKHNARRPEIIDLNDSSPFVEAPKSSAPTFGQTTPLRPRVQLSRPPQNANVGLMQHPAPVSSNSGHQNFHRSSGPLKPKVPGGKSRAIKGMQMFSSMAGFEDPHLLKLRQALQKPSGPPLSSQPLYDNGVQGGNGASRDQVFYTDPEKAKYDLKALLEGGLDEDDDEERAKNFKTALEEDGTLAGIKVKLLPHQVEGVQWMKGRELGPVKRGQVPKGGILADDMGLGKTLQSISLIVNSQRPAGPDAPGWKKQLENVRPATLVVAPLSLIRQWEAEIKEKVDHDVAPLSVCVHHGPQRTKDANALGRKYDVVITTYQILVSEHGSSLDQGCFGVHWYRVILDEAHSIKNRSAKAHQAACALKAEYRWCLTGTPMQNNLEELQSLVAFLRIQPYDNLQEWRANIDLPMKQGKGHIAIRRLHSLLRCFMLRRTKDILREEGALVAGGKKAMDTARARAKEKGADHAESRMPMPAFKVTERKVVTIATEFSPAEREFYNQLEERADKSLEKMMKNRLNYANALVLLLRLRQACNHPKLVEANLNRDRDAMTAETTAAKPPGKAAAALDDDIDALVDVMAGIDIQTRQCEICMGDLTRRETQDGATRCAPCATSLVKFKAEKDPERKKSKKKSRKSVVAEEVMIEKKTSASTRAWRDHRRKVVLDSEDEHDEKGDGSWLVPEDQRGPLYLGKAGGSEDENAEGGGDYVGSEDSEHLSEDGGGSSCMDSFIVHDEQDEEDDEPAHQKFPRVCARRPLVDSSDEGNSDEGSLPPLDRIKKKILQIKTQQRDDEDDSSEASVEDLPDSEVDSDSDSDEGRPRHKRGKSAASASQVMMSAKVRELIGIIRKEVAEHKFIVFSQFTSMLDIIEPVFRAQSGFKSVRYDGKMPNDAREAALRALRTDQHTRILLCSLKCGSLGLNLTAATRVILVEPFWNPFIEEQAIDRVHRLTQTVDVVVYKLTVADTVEERILELQNKKRQLAEAAIEGGMQRGKDGKKNAFKLGLEEILGLFRHDAKTEMEDLGMTSTMANNVAVLRRDRRLESGSSKATAPKPTLDVYARRW